LFAGLRERAGRDELVLDLPDGARVADALAQVEHLAPGVSLVLAVNREYAEPDVVLHAGDELAVVPPVSGGAVVDAPLSLEAVASRVRDPRAGAVVTFSGTTRDVAFLDYEAYVEMAEARIAAIVAAAIARHGLCAAAADHRYGRVPRGEASVVVAASAPHRGEAFAGAREIIDRIKAEAPIWKKEDGGWVAGQAPAAGAPVSADGGPPAGADGDPPADADGDPPAGADGDSRADADGDPPADAGPSHPILDVAIDTRIDHGARVLVVRGADEAEARVGWLGGRFHQLRLVEPLAVERHETLEIRRLGDDELLGEAVVLDPDAPRHGPTNDTLVRLVALERGDDPRSDASIAPPPLDAEARALEQRYVEAGAEPPADADLTAAERAALFALREAGRVVLLERGRHVHVSFAPA
jgi:molybdopterin synthase catalytic subunit/molybdopterin converting factor small subunit